MIAIATALSTLFGLFSAEPKSAPAPSEEPSCCCGASCSTETDGERASAQKPARSQLNSPAKAIYVCPMHPEVTSDTPGLCPKCNMKLELKPSTTTTDARPPVISASDQWERGFFEATRWWPA